MLPLKIGKIYMISSNSIIVETDMPDKSFLSTSEAAKYLKINITALDKITNSGALNPHKTPGGHRRYSIEELNAYKDNILHFNSQIDMFNLKCINDNSHLSENKIVSGSTEQNSYPKKEGTYDSRNTLNDLTGKEWIPETKSYFFQKGLGATHPDAQIEKLHPAPFSYQDISHLVTFFTKQNEKVLDPFGGVGSTAKACAINNRVCTQIELTKKWHDLAIKRLDVEIGPNTSSKHNFILGDSIEELPKFESNTFDFMITSPPYWGILNKKPDHKVMDRVKNNLDLNYSNNSHDLGNITDYNKFVNILVNDVFLQCARVIKTKKYMNIIVSDFRDKNRFISFHADLIKAMDGATTPDNCELTLQGVKILLQNHKSLKPYGYPFAYVENIHHQYVLIFRKMPINKKA